MPVSPDAAAPDSLAAHGLVLAAPWQRSAMAAAGELTAVPGRVGDLARALLAEGSAGPALHAATEAAQSARDAFGEVPDRTVLSRLLPRLEARVAELLRALRPLRGWTLVAVTRVDRVDVFGDCETVEYIDYTGPYERGTPRQVTLIKDLRIGPFVYLSRFAEGIVVPVEPHLRRRPSPETGADELYWAESEIRAPGVHRYRRVVGGQALDDEVTVKQIPRTA
jgi:hypothetical protein